MEATRANPILPGSARGPSATALRASACWRSGIATWTSWRAQARGSPPASTTQSLHPTLCRITTSRRGTNWPRCWRFRRSDEERMAVALRMRVVFSCFAVGIWPLSIGALVVLLILLWYRKRGVPYLICFFIFGVYLLYVLDKIFFPIYISGDYVDALRERPVASAINLNPLYFGRSGTLQTALPGLLMNIILTIPFGF